jgi:hypothetical protein
MKYTLQKKSAFTQLLDELLVLVELLQVIDSHVVKTDSLGLVHMGSISQNAHLHLGTRNVGQTDGTRETLISLGIVVLETNLELNGFSEFSGLLLGRSGQETSDKFTDSRCLNLTIKGGINVKFWEFGNIFLRYKNLHQYYNRTNKREREKEKQTCPTC